MDAIGKLKTACLNKPISNFNDLPIGDHIVENIQRVKTVHGARLRVELKDVVVYLPERFAKPLTDDIVDELNASAVLMTYSGKDPEAKNRLIVSFEAVKMDELGELFPSSDATPNNEEENN